MSGADFRTIVSAGVSLLVRGDDTAPRTVVLLHGIGGRADGFRALMSAWPGDDRLIAWDAPGYGESTLLADATPAPAAYAEALLRTLDGAGVERIHLAGQSLGALFAAAFAVRDAGRVASLTLLAPAHGYRAMADAPPDSILQRIAAFDADGGPAFAAARAARLVNDPARKPQVVAAVSAAMGSLSREGHRPAAHALGQGDIARDCAGLSCPVLLLSGADDQITPLAGTVNLFELLRARPRGPGLREQMTVIGDAGHALFLEHPAAVAAAIHGFIGSGA